MGFNCTAPAIEEFPKDLFSTEQLKHGAIVIHVVTVVYLFTALAKICDQYFVPVVERMCSIFKIPHDIGGATFMACATSSPELFINIIGTFITEGDIGLGTIVGSAVFNILAVTACCGLALALSNTKLKLDWWPLTRDSLVYGISVCVLITFLNNDKVEWYEALILVLVYVAYIILLVFDKHIQNIFKGKSFHPTENDQGADIRSQNIKTIYNISINTEQINMSEMKNDEPINNEDTRDDNTELSIWKCPQDVSHMKKILWIINWPINSTLTLTIPQCEKVKSNKWVPVAFIMCILWIGILSYLVSWMITVIGDTLGIPDSVMGISFLAIGSGVPEAVSSIVVIKKGRGAMGISNSLGSNTFDVLLCLGLPWLLKSCTSIQKLVNINSAGLQYSAIILLITLIGFYFALAINNYKLDRWIGLYCLIIYLIFLVIATMIELNVFFQVNLPNCGR